MFDTTQSDHNSVIFNGLVTGQCGEQPLPPYGSCLLGSVNLTRFVRDPFTAKARFDWEEYRELVKVFTRMLDDVVEINGPQDYRLLRMKGVNCYITPLGPDADRAMNESWLRLTGKEKGSPRSLRFLGRELVVPEAAGGFARFSFADLCAQPLGPADYLEIARNFATVFIDHIPLMGSEMRNEARRFILLIDTLYDQNVHLVCSAAAPPEKLYTAGDGADAFRRTASRLVEMQSEDYLKRGHGR